MRLLLIDDHAVVAQSLRFFLAELDPSIACVAASSMAEALQAEGPFDLVLLDLNMPDSTGFRGLHMARRVFDGVPVAMLSGEQDASLIRASIAEGAMGFVPKSASPQVLMAAVRLMLAGGVYLPTHVLLTEPCLPVNRRTASASDGAPNAAGLSDRQLEILLKAVQGKPNKVIARELNLAEGTIKAHLSAAFRMIGANNRTEAVFKAAQLGLTLPPRPVAVSRH